MRKFFKLITYLIIILILLAVVAGVLVATLVDPNKFKEKISQRVVQETGRTLAINGNIEHSFFPWLGLKVHDVTLGNAPGFSPKEPFLNVGEMDVEVKLLPLLGGAVEIGKIVLKDASLNLAKNAAGQTNWDDLLSKKKKEVVKSEPTEESSPRAKFFKTLSVAGIEVVDANVSWVDQKNNQTIKLTKVSVVSEDIVSGKKFPLTIKFNIAGLPDHLSGEYELNADITLDTQNNLYTLDDFKFNVTMPAENSYEIKGSANKITLDLPDQTLDVVDFKASGNALEMEADLHVEQLVEAPVYTGNLNVKSSNLRNFLKAIKKEVQTKDTNVLGNFSFSANFRGTDNSLRLDAVNLHLDDSISKGNANITSFKPLAVDFNQTIDQLNVDRYRKPDASPSPAMSTEQASALPSQPTVSADTSNKTDFASLRKLTIGGGLNIGLLTVGETEFSQVHVQLLLQNGVLNVSPFTAQVHGGKAQSQITANFQENVPHYAIHSIVSHVDLAKVSQSEHVVGLINLNMQLTTQGVTKKEMLASLNGALQFDVEKGSLKGVNIPFEIDRALALAKKQPLPQPPAINETEFGVFSGSGMIQNGVFSNNDLLMQSSKFKVTGQGTANIVSEMIDYRLRAVGMETIKNADGTEIEKERQTEIPLIVTGTFSKPIVAPDVIAIARGLLKEKLQQKIDQNFQSAKEKAVELKDKVQETTEKTAEDAKEKAGQLFQQLLQ